MVPSTPSSDPPQTHGMGDHAENPWPTGAPPRTWWQAAGIVAILSGLGAMAADITSGWSSIPDSAMETALSLQIEQVAPLLLVKSQASLLWGHYLALLFIPLGILGVWYVSVLLGSADRRWAVSFLILGTLTFAAGAAYHISFGFVATVLQAGDPVLTQQIAPFFEPFGTVVILALVATMVPLVGAILTGRTVYPRWMAALTPVPLMLGLSLLAKPFPAAVENLVIVTGINASMTLFLVLTMATTHSRIQAGHERSPWEAG